MAVAAERGARGDVSLRVRAGWVALVVGSLVFAGKLGAYALTGSAAVFSDAMESVVNVVAGALLLWSLFVASRPADRDHPYGHGKVEFFSAGVEGALISGAALLILYEAVLKLVTGFQPRQLDLGAVVVAGLAAVNALLGAWLVRVGRRTRSLALEADGRHILTDVVTSVGVVLGLVAVRATGLAFLDPLVAMAVALSILRTGYFLLRGAVGGLMDEADESLLGPVCRALEEKRQPWWIDVHGLRTFRSGDFQHTDLHLAVPRYFDAERLHRVDAEIREVVVGATGHPGDVIVHFDPCRPRQCPACAMPECAVRAGALVRRLPITLESAVRGDEALDSGAPLGPQERG
jgi:cation diffusion facilitator family transporter